MITIESATRLVAEVMATTALDYDVLANDGIDGLSAHEVLIEYSNTSAETCTSMTTTSSKPSSVFLVNAQPQTKRISTSS